MKTQAIMHSAAMRRWTFALSVVGAGALVDLALRNGQQDSLDAMELPMLVAGAVLAVLMLAYFMTFPDGIAIIHRGIRRATEGVLEPIEVPRRVRLLFGPIAEDFNLLVRNMGSLFREMEQSQLAIIGHRNRNDAILRSLPGALLTVDSDFRITLSNTQAEQLFDMRTDMLIGKNLFDLLSLNEDGRELLREAFLYEQQVMNKEIMLAQGAVARYYTLNITFFKQAPDAAQSCAAVMLQDITEYKRLQELIHQSEKFLAMGKLAGGVAHELNTPLGTIVGYAQLLNQGVANEDKRDRYAQAIYHEAKRCTAIIENLRKFAQRNVCQSESCDVSKVVNDVIETINICPGRNQDVRIETRLESGAVAQGAEGQLDIVLVNLIMNAVHAAAGTAPNPLVTVETSIQGENVMVTVTDNGRGIPQTARNRVFDPFCTTNPDGGGLGLGLAISQSIVTQIGGSLNCDTAYEGGARFVMLLPPASGGNK